MRLINLPGLLSGLEGPTFGRTASVRPVDNRIVERSAKHERARPRREVSGGLEVRQTD